MERVQQLLRHPAISTGMGTVFGYGLILAVLLIALFVVPYVIFTSL